MKYIYPGAIHIHTKYSDGTSDIKNIAREAKKAGLSWIVITDHNTLQGLKNNEEGFYDGVAVIIGNEISPDSSDHYLAFDVQDETSLDIGAQGFIEDVKKQGGFGFIAHPDESLERENNYKPLRWTDWETKGFDGIEIWNYASDWVDGYDPKNAIFHHLFRQHRLTGPTTKTLKWWDQANNENNHIVPGIAGVDAHALIYRKGPFQVKFADYFDTFRSITNGVYLKEKLSENFESAKRQILNGIKYGNNLIINRVWNKKPEFPLFYIENKFEKAFSGEKIQLDKYSRMIVKLPQKATLRVIYDGQLIWEYETKELDFNNLDIGKYRIEVYYKEKPWVFSNPIQIYQEETNGHN